jgi:hypothetical protein
MTCVEEHCADKRPTGDSLLKILKQHLKQQTEPCDRRYLLLWSETQVETTNHWSFYTNVLDVFLFCNQRLETLLRSAECPCRRNLDGIVINNLLESIEFICRCLLQNSQCKHNSTIATYDTRSVEFVLIFQYTVVGFTTAVIDSGNFRPKVEGSNRDAKILLCFQWHRQVYAVGRTRMN